MKPLAEMVFIGEIVMQSKIALRAAERLPAATGHVDQVEVWCAIQSILGAAGNVSKILWPQKGKFASRGERLRNLLKVDDANVLSDRKFRNHFEHYDERIEDWFKNSRSAVYMDSRIDQCESTWGRNPPNVHRAYDPRTQTLVFRGESVDLAAILNALEEIRHRCRHFVLP